MLETNEIIGLASLAAIGAWYFAGSPGAMSLFNIFGTVVSLVDKIIKASENTDSNFLTRYIAKVIVVIIGGALFLLFIFRRSLPSIT